MKYPIIHEDMLQNSPEWHAIRRGKVTTSVFSIAVGKGDGRKKLMKNLRDERTGVIRLDGFCSDAMNRGTEMEDEARAEYIRRNGPTTRVGFIELNDYIGASTDDLIGQHGVLEIKCPNSSTHNDWREDNKLPTTHRYQVHGGLWVTGRQWCDFVSYDPRVTECPYWCIRVARDEAIIAELQIKIGKFVDELKARMDRLAGPKF